MSVTLQFDAVPAFPRGFRCASRNVGLEPTARDLTRFVSDVDAAAAVFTRNHFPGAPVILDRETIRGGRLRAIISNCKVSNVTTGAEGVQFARRMAAAAMTRSDDEVRRSRTAITSSGTTFCTS